MRLKLTLSCQPYSKLSLNYAYALQAVIYKVLERADPKFSHWLHEKGYDSTGKNFKLFTFSELRGTRFQTNREQKTICFESNKVEWGVSFYVDEQIEKFVMGLFQQQRLEVVTPTGRVDFDVQNVEIQQVPQFFETMRFRTKMPIFISEKQEGREHAAYLSPTDNNYERLFFSNLESKFKVIHGDENQIDFESFNLKILTEPKSRKFDVIKKNLARPISVIGYQFDFEVTAPIEWLRIGYYAGFGGKNSNGFGYCEILK